MPDGFAERMAVAFRLSLACALHDRHEVLYDDGLLIGRLLPGALRSTPHLPEIQHIVRTNFCDLGFALAADGRRLIMVSCLDNLLKGAAGQAVQNLNLMCGWNEEEGLL